MPIDVDAKSCNMLEKGYKHQQLSCAQFTQCRLRYCLVVDLSRVYSCLSPNDGGFPGMSTRLQKMDGRMLFIDKRGYQLSSKSQQALWVHQDRPARWWWATFIQMKVCNYMVIYSEPAIPRGLKKRKLPVGIFEWVTLFSMGFKWTTESFQFKSHSTTMWPPPLTSPIKD